MRVLPFKIQKPLHDALIFQKDHKLVFYDQLHQHEEIQVSLIAKGEGTLIVGNTINHYKEGDLLVIGSNLPHVFKSDLAHNEKSIMITIFFTRSSFGSGFFQIEEMQQIQTFFKRSTNGFRALSHSSLLHELMSSLEKKSKFDRLITLLNVLRVLSRCRFQPLSSFIYAKHYSDTEGKRLSAVMDYTMDHFKEKISLEEIAAVAAMTKNAFCKYFKKRTNKTYVQFLNELRIEHACKLLMSPNELDISSIAEVSGFNNLSNFNRQFKAIKKTTPKNYASLF